MSKFQLKVPAIKEKTQTQKVPEYVRLDVGRPGLLGKLAPRPVLHRSKTAGSAGNALAVSKALTSLVADDACITVTGASVRAFRWYRFLRSFGSLFSTVATIIGALLVALGALGPKSGLGRGLLIAGIALTIVGVFALLFSYWRSPPD